MKKIPFLMIGLSFCLSARCQQIVISNSVVVPLPNRYERLSIEQAKAQEKKKFPNSPHANIGNAEDKYLYLTNDILIAFLFRNIGEDLADRKKNTDGFYTRRGNAVHHNSSFVTINSNLVYIMSDTIDNVSWYHFYCCNNSNTSELIGVLQFDVADKDKATAVLNDLLKSIKFTK